MIFINPDNSPNVHAYLPNYKKLTLVSENDLERSFAVVGHTTGLVKGSKLELGKRTEPAVLKFENRRQMSDALDILLASIAQHAEA